MLSLLKAHLLMGFFIFIATEKLCSNPSNALPLITAFVLQFGYTLRRL